MTPSRKRRLLSLYLDYLVFAAVYQPVAWAIRSTGIVDNWWVALVVFGIVRSITTSVLNRTTPGQWALGIRTERTTTVDPRIRQRERWWTVAVGTLLVLEGSKNLVRWTQGLPIEPLLGASSPQWMATVAITILGGLNIAAGLLILRTRAIGALIGMGVLGVEALAAIVHREAFRAWAGEAVAARRALQGLPVREGEVEMMQALSTTILPGALTAGVICLLVVAIRFKGADHASPSRPAARA